MNLKFVAAAAASAFFAAVSPASSAVNLISNGSFEIGTDPGGSFINVPGPNSTTITDWTIGGASIDYIGGYWDAGDGARSVDLSGLNLGSVSQNFAATIGTQYTVGFLLAGNPDGPPATKQVGVDVNGEFQVFSFPVVFGEPTRHNMGWTSVSFTFVANTTTETLKFVSFVCGDNGDNPCAFGAALDGVSVSAVPETSTWIMMLLGFAALGWVSYRRSKTSIFAIKMG